MCYRLPHTPPTFRALDSITFVFSDLKRSEKSYRKRLCKTSSSSLVSYGCASTPNESQNREGDGFAFGRSFTRKVATMIELRTESSIDFQRDQSCW